VGKLRLRMSSAVTTPTGRTLVARGMTAGRNAFNTWRRRPTLSRVAQPLPGGNDQPMEPVEFVPADFVVPTSLGAPLFRLEPLGPQHNEADYAAWTSSIDHIRSTPGFPDGNWPDGRSFEDNLRDLHRHADDFANRRGFTFTVLDPDTADVVGCVYIYPSKDGIHDASVQSWLRASEAEHEAAFRAALAEWLVSDAWPFQRPLYQVELD
jgi:hypothetical protein